MLPGARGCFSSPWSTVDMTETLKWILMLSGVFALGIVGIIAIGRYNDRRQ